MDFRSQKSEATEATESASCPFHLALDAEPRLFSQIPPHIPLECIVDIDVYHMPDADRDFLLSWKRLQDSSRRGLFWTPRNGGHWIVTRGREIARIYSDHQNFSSRTVMVPKEICERHQLLPTTLDPPEHRPYRHIMMGAITPAIIDQVRPQIRQIVIDIIESFLHRGQCEFISEFAERLPVAVFLHMANLPAGSCNSLPCCAEELLHADGSSSSTAIIDAYAEFLRPIVLDRQRQPGDDLLSRIASGTVNGRPLTIDETVDISTAMMTGGLDTVTSTLGLMIAFFARNPGHRQQLFENPSLVPVAVTELLRRFPVMTKARLIRHDQTIEGICVKAGEVVVLPPLQGLDEREFDDPLAVDFARAPSPHLTFGHGVHRCPGASLTHAQMEITLEEWLARIPHFKIPAGEEPSTQGGVLGAVLRLPIQWKFSLRGLSAHDSSGSRRC